MIVRGSDDEAALLDKCLESVKGHVDAIFIDVNAPEGQKPSKKVIAVAKKHGADVKETVWEGNFVKARSNNFARVPKDYNFIVWLDSDDTVENPEKMKEVCAIVSNDVSGIYIEYEYAHDEYGNVTVSHYPSRIIRNNGTFKWQSSFEDADVTVHETLNQIRNVGKVMNDEFKVIHHSNEERRDASLVRNIKLLEGMLKRQAKKPDPRILFYLATHYVDAGLWARAEELFTTYLTMSGWGEERSQAWVYLGDIWKAKGDRAKARGCYMKALAENPTDPSPLVELGELEIADQMFEKAIEWLTMAADKKQKDTVIVTRPMETTYRTYKLLADAYSNTGAKGLKTASKWLTKALKLRPFDPELQEARTRLDEILRIRDLNEAVLKIVNEMREGDEVDKIVGLVDHLPYELQESPLIHGIRNQFTKPRKWKKNSIAIICGTSALGAWGPWSLRQGIGGSEEAVIQLSKELTKLGWDVTVYAIPGRRVGDHDGVHWRHYWEANTKDEYDVVIGWRDPSLFDKQFKARKKYLWLHDVVDEEEMTEERIANLDGVIFVSQYHRELFPMVPEDKAFASGNGIAPEDFEALDGKIERNPHKVIYMSAHERGQELLQVIWNDVVKEVPDAELHCYYGWKGYDHVNRDNPERMGWKQQLIEGQKRLKSFYDHGKVGHQKIVEECFSAGIWAYPCPFPEVYCITAVKAQAGGAYPVTSDYAALKETVKYGTRLPMKEADSKSHVGSWTRDELEKYKEALIDALKHSEKANEIRTEMMAWARENMSWAATAKSWSERFGYAK